MVTKRNMKFVVLLTMMLFVAGIVAGCGGDSGAKPAADRQQRHQNRRCI